MLRVLSILDVLQTFASVFRKTAAISAYAPRTRNPLYKASAVETRANRLKIERYKLTRRITVASGAFGAVNSS